LLRLLGVRFESVQDISPFQLPSEWFVSIVEVGDAEEAAHPLARAFWAKLIRFGQFLLDLGKIWVKLIRFGQN